MAFEPCEIGESHPSVKEAWKLLNVAKTGSENLPDKPQETLTQTFSDRLKDYQNDVGLVRSGVHDRRTWLALNKQDKVCDYRRWATRRGQTSGGTCWKACTAMLYNCFEYQIPTFDFNTASDGGLQLSGANLDAFARTNGLTRVPMNESMGSFAQSFMNRGPLMLSIIDDFFGFKAGGDDVHFVLCVMIRGDYQNDEDTSLMIYDPWPPHSNGRNKRFTGAELLAECTNYFYRNTWTA